MGKYGGVENLAVGLPLPTVDDFKQIDHYTAYYSSTLFVFPSFLSFSIKNESVGQKHLEGSIIFTDNQRILVWFTKFWRC